MKRFTVAGLMLGMLLMAVCAFGAVVPQVINYSGSLTNKSGVAAPDGTYDIEFNVYNVSTAGTALWTEKWSATAIPSSPVLVTGGLFNVMLGAITPFPEGFFANNPNTYLGIKVGADSEMLPRQKIASVGYAFAAGNGVPKGGIIMWSGAITAIPEGWALCDGTNGTPNLRDQFVVGAGSTYPVAATGGKATHVLTTNEIPSHYHPVDPPSTQTGGQTADHSHTVNGSGGTDNSNNSTYVRTDNQGGNHPPTGGASNDHTHWLDIAQFNSGNTGSGAAHNNLPPYYALAFIMKL